MSDFQQNGSITTFHNLTKRPIGELEAEVKRFAKSRPVTLLLPSLFSELENDALSDIVDELCDVDYLSEIYIGLDRADEEQYRFAKQFFARLPQHHRVLWNDGPRMSAIHDRLSTMSIAPEEPGKGRNVWYLLGYALAAQRGRVLALHDCDIVTYDRSMLAKLIYPVLNANFQYVFSKGYYSRIGGGTLNGRVARLLVTPLLEAMQRVFGAHSYLGYLSAFRYPLSGEFAMSVDVVPNIRIPSDWGLEIGFLSEIRRNASERQIAQVDIADTYDHKHQNLMPDDQSGGLSRMSIDIVKAILRKLATEGIAVSPSQLRALRAAYYRNALDLIESYNADAIMNGLRIDRHREEQAVELFAGSIVEAGDSYLRDPAAAPFIPNWRRVHSAYPEIYRDLIEAVETDMKEV